MERNHTIAVLAELGRRMEAWGATADGAAGAAAVNVARDMLAPEVVARWLALYPGLPVATPRRVLVVTAGNIPFVGVQDLISVLAAGHEAVVRPSSRDGGRMEWVVGQLLDIAPDLPVSLAPDDSGDVALSGGCSAADPACPDAVIAMGGDAAVAAIGALYPGVPALLRGHRSSAALLAGDETEAELRVLARDVLAYSGLGCRNVSLALVPRGWDPAPLGRALMAVGAEMAGGSEMAVGARRDGGYRQARAMLRMADAPHVDCGVCLLVERGDFSPHPSVLNYAFYDDAPEAARRLEEREGELQCVALSPRLALAHPRAVPLGQTQHPRPWDYPDGVDTMQFLAAL